MTLALSICYYGPAITSVALVYTNPPADEARDGTIEMTSGFLDRGSAGRIARPPYIVQ
jgi:hypothetical protein